MIRKTLYLYLKEGVLRFNHRHDNAYEILLNLCRKLLLNLP